jgi:hypothetical protein
VSKNFSLQNDKSSDISGHVEPITIMGTSVKRGISGSSNEGLMGKARDFMAEVREANAETRFSVSGSQV